MSVDYRVIGQRVQRIRKEQKLTQEQLAERLAVSVGYISQIERGVTKANLDMLSNISSYLDCPLAELICGVASGQKSYLSGELEDLYSMMDDVQKQLLCKIAQNILEVM